MVYSFEGTVNTDWDCFTLGVIEREMTQSRRKILWLLDQFEKEMGSSSQRLLYDKVIVKRS